MTLTAVGVKRQVAFLVRSVMNQSMHVFRLGSRNQNIPCLGSMYRVPRCFFAGSTCPTLPADVNNDIAPTMDHLATPIAVIPSVSV
ncbi:hypothetical protein NC653_028168 [Populus alba x Populus x berolinensis]|uniref:Uncharacterized protein n=1 Tax=Populus alba x Populus x berolinensis TaxID=444605 RepID=A0AAD6M7Q8_9ROSI|nr:hypothetical protein NC653_028168 [Populus alba x Populus x berolinensis]